MRRAVSIAKLMPMVALVLGLAAGVFVTGVRGIAAAQRRATAQAPPRPFSEVELRALRSGGLVVRRKSERRGNQILLGGTSWQVVALPPDAVWRAVLDTPRYTKMLPACTAARVVETVGSRRTIFLGHQSGLMRASYYLNTRVYADRRDLTFVLDARRPRSVRAAWGFFTVRPYGEGRSLLSYGLMADFGDGLVGGIVRQRLHAWSLRVPATIKAYLEGSGRTRYLPAERLRGAPGVARDVRALARTTDPSVDPLGRTTVAPRSVSLGAVVARSSAAATGSGR